MAIEIDGKKYQVTENLGFVHGRGQYAKYVLTEIGERVVVRDPYRGAPWRFAAPIILPMGRIVGQG